MSAVQAPTYRSKKRLSNMFCRDTALAGSIVPISLRR
jgi:hypothetical protein